MAAQRRTRGAELVNSIIRAVWKRNFSVPTKQLFASSLQVSSVSWSDPLLGEFSVCVPELQRREWGNFLCLGPVSARLHWGNREQLGDGCAQRQHGVGAVPCSLLFLRPRDCAILVLHLDKPGFSFQLSSFVSGFSLLPPPTPKKNSYAEFY